MSFTYSYGKDSWEREKNEYRYTFNINKLLINEYTLKGEDYIKDYYYYKIDNNFLEKILQFVKEALVFLCWSWFEALVVAH